MKSILLLLLSISCLLCYAQETLEGTVLTKEGSKDIPLEGASIYWLDTQVGATTNEKGYFKLDFQK